MAIALAIILSVRILHLAVFATRLQRMMDLIPDMLAVAGTICFNLRNGLLTQPQHMADPGIPATVMPITPPYAPEQQQPPTDWISAVLNYGPTVARVALQWSSPTSTTLAMLPFW